MGAPVGGLKPLPLPGQNPSQADPSSIPTVGNGTGNGKPYDPNDQNTWVTGSPAPAGTFSPIGGGVQYGTNYTGPMVPGTDPRVTSPQPVTPTPAPETAGAFTSGSSSQELLSALNAAGAAPGTDAFNAITAQYKAATGLSGGPGNGFDYLQFDPGRSKIYAPGGSDLRYENGQWVAHSNTDSGGGSDTSSGGANTSSDAAVQNAPFLGAFQSALLSQLQNLTDPSQNGVNDPNLKPAIDANHLSTARGLEDTNRSLAEAAYANGTLSDGSFSTAKQKASEDAAANEANFKGNAVLTNQQMRQQALMNLLGIGNAQTGLALQQQQGADTLGYNYATSGMGANAQAVLGLLSPGGGM